jgi:hypothetical protein
MSNTISRSILGSNPQGVLAPDVSEDADRVEIVREEVLRPMAV